MNFNELITAIHDTEIKYPHLKAVMLAQCMLETGRSTTELAVKYNNPAGMKWREEMVGYAEQVYVETESEPSGGADFCKFANAKAGVIGYWKFLSRSPYAGWEDHVGNAADFLQYIGRIWCAAGYTDSWIFRHGNKNYDQYIMDFLYQEALEHLGKLDAPTPLGDVSWFEMNMNDRGEPLVVGYAGAVPKVLMTSKLVEDYIKLFKDHPNAKTLLVAPAGKSVPGLPDYNRGETKPTIKFKGRLSCGHSRKTPGARSKNGLIKEEIQNELTVKVIQEELALVGIQCDLFNPDPDNLVEVGRSSAGYDFFVDCHHNSYSGNGDNNGGPYSCVMVLPPGRCKDISVEFAHIIAVELDKALGLKPFSGTHGTQGVYQTGLTVLNESEKVCQGPCVLTESYFLNGIQTQERADELTVKAAKAIARGIRNYYGI